MKTIVVAGIITASNTDILSGTKLSTAPGPGTMLVELQSSANTASNNFDVTMQLPGGDTPLTDTRITAGTAGELHDDLKTMFSHGIGQGGSLSLSATLTGTATLTYRVSWVGVA